MTKRIVLRAIDNAAWAIRDYKKMVDGKRPGVPAVDLQVHEFLGLLNYSLQVSDLLLRELERVYVQYEKCKQSVMWTDLLTIQKVYRLEFLRTKEDVYASRLKNVDTVPRSDVDRIFLLVFELLSEAEIFMEMFEPNWLEQKSEI